MYDLKRNNMEQSWVLSRFQWHIEKQSFSLFLGSGLTLTFPRSITISKHSQVSTSWKILEYKNWNTEFCGEFQNTSVKTRHKGSCKIVAKNKLTHIWINYLIAKLELLRFQIYNNFSVVKNPLYRLIMRPRLVEE